jgi:threonylcarbamoyladenosine tRNA methylthiotransferase MtaB
MNTAALATLGCKVNQCESAYLAERLARAGYRIRSFAETADLYCINTCVVTGRAAMQSRQLIRRAIRRNQEAQVVVMGCYPQVAAAEIAAIPGVSHVLGTTEKLGLLDYLGAGAAAPCPRISVSDARLAPQPPGLAFSAFSGRTRAFLKIQDGCDAFCSYCIIPYARGRSRSVTTESVLQQVRRFLTNGYQEIVLTGIHLGRWGRDLTPQLDLAALLRSILERTPPPRLRLSSLEPAEVTAELLDLMADAHELCPHLHVPLQSGDPTVLRRMNRHYQPARYRELVAEAQRRMPDLAVGTDVLVGFPGETAQRFDRTFRLLEALPVAYLHVFPFSPRPGTPAADMDQQVPSPVIRERCRHLRQLDRVKRLEFMRRFVGTTRPVLVEGRLDSRRRMRFGFSDNYLPVLVPADAAGDNQVIAATFEKLEGMRLLGLPGCYGRRLKSRDR